MATAFKSDQTTLTDAVPKSLIAPDELGGKVRRAYFTKTLPGSGLATGDSIDLVDLPIGARVLGGQFCWDAGQGVTATTAIGYSGATGRYFAAAVTNATTIFRIADTQAQNYGDKLTAAKRILATNAAAAWTASSVFKGHIDYIVE